MKKDNLISESKTLPPAQKTRRPLHGGGKTSSHGKGRQLNRREGTTKMIFNTSTFAARSLIETGLMPTFEKLFDNPDFEFKEEKINLCTFEELHQLTKELLEARKNALYEASQNSPGRLFTNQS